ncbi:hypothetical protein GCM10027174_24910 [Salinifilum aidingensis]
MDLGAEREEHLGDPRAHASTTEDTDQFSRVAHVRSSVPPTLLAVLGRTRERRGVGISREMPATSPEKCSRLRWRSCATGGLRRKPAARLLPDRGTIGGLPRAGFTPRTRAPPAPPVRLDRDAQRSPFQRRELRRWSRVDNTSGTANTAH